VFLVFYIFAFFIFGDPVLSTMNSVVEHIGNPTVWIRLLFLGYYLFQLTYYTYLFLVEARKYNNELLNYFSEVYQLKLRWVYVAFFSALAVGTIALIASFLPASFDWMITLIFSVFYFAFAQEYIKYNKVFKTIEPAITVQPVEIQPTVQPLRIKTEWNSYKKEIITQRYYCETGITIEDLAQKLRIGRTTLSNFINREEGVNFNTWINKLRIEEAKLILINNPELPLVYVAEHVGFTEQSNFSRQFKLLTGESPMVWRKGAVAS
jgi:AraC-like DNA-binding protein